MTRAQLRAVQRNQRGLRRRSVGPAVLSRPHGLSTGAGVAVRVLEVAAPASIGAVSLSLRAPEGGRLRGEAPAGLVIEITGTAGVTAAAALAADDQLTLTLTEPLATALAAGDPVTLYSAEHVFPHAAPLKVHHDRLPATLIGQVEAEYVLPALPRLPRPRPGDRLRVGDVEGIVLDVPSAMAGLYVVQIGGAS